MRDFRLEFIGQPVAARAIQPLRLDDMGDRRAWRRIGE